MAFRMGLYHIINTEPDAPCALEAISDDGLYGWVPLDPSALEVPVHMTHHRISPLVHEEHLVLSMNYMYRTLKVANKDHP